MDLKENDIIDLDKKEAKEFISNTDMPIEELLSYFYHRKDRIIEKNEQNDIKQENEMPRFYEDKRTCYYCFQIGHVENKCDKKTEHFCILCTSTEHNKNECPMQFCTRCYHSGHKFFNCRNDNIRYLICKRCPGFHNFINCPLKYRRYRNAKNFGEIEMSCDFCSNNTHFTDDCMKSRYQISIFTKNYKKFL